MRGNSCSCETDRQKQEEDFAARVISEVVSYIAGDGEYSLIDVGSLYSFAPSHLIHMLFLVVSRLAAVDAFERSWLAGTRLYVKASKLSATRRFTVWQNNKYAEDFFGRLSSFVHQKSIVYSALSIVAKIAKRQRLRAHIVSSPACLAPFKCCVVDSS